MAIRHREPKSDIHTRSRRAHAVRCLEFERDRRGRGIEGSVSAPGADIPSGRDYFRDGPAAVSSCSKSVRSNGAGPSEATCGSTSALGQADSARRWRSFGPPPPAVGLGLFGGIQALARVLTVPNPANRNLLDRIFSTVLNSKTEVKIGTAIYLYLPHREITIRNGDTSILKYIRTKGNLPRINAPVSEPENGLPIAVAQPPVDPNIVVTSTDRENGCGDVSIGTGEFASGRLSFHSNIKGKGLIYYWNFGDGYVSYKENPTHAYSDSAVHSVTLAVFNNLGLRCGSTSGLQTGSGTGSGTSGTHCTLPVTFVIQGSNLTIGGVVNVSGIFTQPLTINWDFGDGGFSISNPTSHIYQVAGTYPVTVTATDGAGCVYTNQAQVTASNPPPPNPQCCTKYDKQKDGTLSSGGNHMFKHTLKTTNSWGIQPQVYANVTTYTKTAGIWFWSYNTSGVNIAGNVFENDPKTNSCGNSFAVSQVQTGKYFFNTIRIRIPFKPIYTEFQSVTSDGSAFGDNDHNAISDCQ